MPTVAQLRNVRHSHLAFENPEIVQMVDRVKVHIKQIGHFSRVDMIIELFTKLLQPASISRHRNVRDNDWGVYHAVIIAKS